MDALSRLLALHPLRAALEVRCHFAAPWVIDHPVQQPGVAPYHMIVEGRAWLESGQGEPIPLQAGDIIVFPHGVAHRIRTDDAEQATPQQITHDTHVLKQSTNGGTGATAEVLCGQFEFDDPAGVLLRAMPGLIHVRTAGREDFAGLRSLVAMLRAEASSLRPGTAALLAQLSSALFALVIRAWLEDSAEQPGLFALLAERRLQAALQAMLAEPGADWPLEKLAALCHMSRATFARLFGGIAGTTPAAFLLDIRMAQAAALLAQGRASGDVGEAVGYQSEAAFNRVFKRHFQIAPGAFRRQKRAN